MLKNQIKVGGFYNVQAAEGTCVVQVINIRSVKSVGDSRNRTVYDAKGWHGRKTTINSAKEFLEESPEQKWGTSKKVKEAAKQPTRPTKSVNGKSKTILPVATKKKSKTVALNSTTSPSIPTSSTDPTTSSQPSLAERLRKTNEPSTDTAPHVIVEALAGTGKTTTLVEGLRRVKGLESKLIPSPQQAAVWEQMELSKGRVQSICFCAFNRSIRDELQRRVPEGCSCMTMHGMGLRAVTKVFPNVKVTDSRVQELISEILDIDIWELRRKKAEVLKATEHLVGLCKMNLSNIDPCENRLGIDDPDWQEVLSNLTSRYDIDLNGNESEVFGLVPRVLERCLDVAKDGCIDYNDMIWLPIALNLSTYQYDMLLVDEVQDLSRAQQELAIKSGKRLILCGDSHQCQPSGTVIRCSNNRAKTIESLKVGDLVVSYNTGWAYCTSHTSGRLVKKIASRYYCGPMYWVNGARSTPNHKWLTRFRSGIPSGITATYLAELKDGTYRIGITQLVLGKNAGGFGPGMRARQRRAKKVWVLGLHNSREEAREAEFKCSIKYQIPQLSNYEKTEDQWCLDLVASGCLPDISKLLKQFGRKYDYPIWQEGSGRHIGKYGYVTEACNLLPGINQVCKWIPGNTRDTGSWIPLELKIEPNWSGKVYSLEIEPTERGQQLYISDGVVTHNSIYGFAGADSDSMARLEKRLNTTERGCVCLPLTVTRRCGKVIVKEAQRYVSVFEAFETNPEGTITSAKYKTETTVEVNDPNRPTVKSEIDSYHRLVKDGDMILCRCNAPLVSQCFKFLRAGRKAVIQGRDVGAGLVGTVKKVLKVKDETELERRTVVDLIAKLDEWHYQESSKERAKRNPSDGRLINLQDRLDCLMCFCEGQQNAMQVVRKINSIFTDDNSTTGIRLSSIHKAKGLEADSVYFLMPQGAECPHPMAKTPQDREQELHLRYVGITRAINNLIYVS